MNILLVGPPGSGKSTQADLLADRLGLPHFKTGDLFYYLSKAGSPLGKEIKMIMESGKLVDDQLTLRVVGEHLKGKQYQNGVILDGTPRNLAQAEKFKLKLNVVFYLDVSDKENIKRLTKRGRGDTDKPAVIKKRLEVYHHQTEPMLNYYQQKGLLEKIDGEREIEIILQDILEKAETIQGN